MNMTHVLPSSAQFGETIPNLLRGILESLTDGILILTQQGKCLYENLNAQRICRQMSQKQPQTNSIPLPIWDACKALINSHHCYDDRPLVIESEITLSRKMTYRIRVRWFQQHQSECSTLLVMLEDCYQSLQNQVLGEIHLYGLTAREAEVWALYRNNFSYKEIASELYITLNTVKKHIKNILAKRRIALDLDE